MAPATAGPAAAEMAMAIELKPMIVPSMRCGTAALRFIEASPMIAPAPNPCMKRAATSTGRLPASTQAVDASVNTVTPMRKTRLGP